jgi:hypothetical protein
VTTFAYVLACLLAYPSMLPAYLPACLPAISIALQAYADDDSFSDATKITYRAADGSLATTTVSYMHMMHVINNPGPNANVATPKACRCPALGSLVGQCSDSGTLETTSCLSHQRASQGM